MHALATDGGRTTSLLHLLRPPLPRAGPGPLPLAGRHRDALPAVGAVPGRALPGPPAAPRPPPPAAAAAGGPRARRPRAGRRPARAHAGGVLLHLHPGAPAAPVPDAGGRRPADLPRRRPLLLRRPGAPLRGPGRPL